MRQLVLPATVLAVLFVTSSALALRVANPVVAPVQRAVTVDAVVVGKVVAIEADTVLAEPYRGSPNKVPFKMAVLKVDAALAGAPGLTHLKVGFQPPPEQPMNRNPGVPVRRPGFQPPTLTQDQAGCFFLVKHPTANFYTLQPSAPPLDAKAKEYPKQLEHVKAALAAVADPKQALTADRAEDRIVAATALVAHYRTIRPGAGRHGPEPIDPAESKLILKALLERDWSKFDADLPPAVVVFNQLGLTPQDGWQQPAFNGQGDFNAFLKKSVEKWLEGEGSKFVIKKLVPQSK